MPRIVRALLALALTAIAELLSFATYAYLGNNTLIILLAAVVVSALYLGLVPAIITAIAGTVSHNYFHQFPLHSLAVSSRQDVFELLIFLMTALMVSGLTSALRNAYLRVEQAIRDREQLMSIVSHDLKNPVSAVRLATQLLRRLPNFDETAGLPRIVGQIEASVDRMESLLQNLLEFEKLKAGRLEIRMELQSVADLFAASRATLEPIAEAKSIQLQYVIRPPEIVLRVDRERILEVLSNLVGNSVKFSPPGTLVRVQAELHGSEAQFLVQDQGPGIAAADLPHVFERFWQSERTARHGTGLGLTITRALVEAHGGKIWVSSKSRRGATFYFNLPAARMAPEAAA